MEIRKMLKRESIMTNLLELSEKEMIVYGGRDAEFAQDLYDLCYGIARFTKIFSLKYLENSKHIAEMGANNSPFLWK